MANDLISGPERDNETGEQRHALWKRFVAGCDTHWPIRWPMANGILLILLVGWLVPLVPDALSAFRQGISASWMWLRIAGDGTPAAATNAETIRNLSLTLGGPLALVALFLAWRRTFDARRQTETQIQQSRTQIEQARIAERSQQSDRFGVAIQNLVSGKTASEITAVETLDQLRRENPSVYERTVFRILAECISDTEPKNDGIRKDTKFSKYDKINHRIWDIITSEKTPIKIGESYIQYEIYRTECPKSAILIEDCEGINFNNVKMPIVYISNEITNTFFYECRISRVTISEADFGKIGDFDWIFISCIIGKIDITRKFEIDEHIFQLLFNNCKYEDGSEVNFPITK